MANAPVEKYPVVPDQLYPLIDDRILDIYEGWRKVTYSELAASTPQPFARTLENGREIRFVELYPKGGDWDEHKTLAIFHAHAQPWNPKWYLHAEITRQIANPEGRAIVFPHNRRGDSYYDLTPEELALLQEGSIRPLAELQSRTLAEKNVGRLATFGYSLGGILSIAVAAIGSSDFEVTHVGSTEAPNEYRTRQELARAFRKEGLKSLKQAVADADLPALNKSMQGMRLYADLASFGIDSLRKENRTLQETIAHTAPSLGQMLPSTFSLDDKTTVGRVEGSLICTEAGLEDIGYHNPNVRFRVYTGEGAHGHATGDNPMARALMALDSQRPAA